MSKNPLVFMSYSHYDAEHVLPVAERLKASGVRVWLDKWELRVGSKFIHEIEAALTAASAVVLFVSRHSLKSGWVKEEYEAAKVLEIERRMKILPVVLDQSALPTFLAGTHATFLPAGGLLSVCADIVDAVMGSKALYEFERTLRSYQGKPFGFRDRSLERRKARAIEFAISVADNRKLAVRTSMKAGADARVSDSSVFKWGWNTARDYTQWLVMRYAAKVLTEASPERFSRKASPVWFVDELYRHILVADRDFGLTLSRSIDPFLAQDLGILMSLLTGHSDLTLSAPPTKRR